MAATAGRPRRLPRLRGLLLVLTGVALVVAAVPAPPVRGETQTLTAPAKAVLTGTQQGTYTASDLAADDDVVDRTTSGASAAGETWNAQAGSGLVTGTEVNTYADTAANDNTRHEIRAVDTFGTPTSTSPGVDAKNVRKGTQAGSFSPADLTADDGAVDTTLAAEAGDDASPSLRSATAESAVNAGWSNPGDAYASDDVYATTSSNGREHAFFGWGFLLPTGATVTLVELLVEWKVAAAGRCLRWKSSVDAGSSWSGHTTSPGGSTTDRIDTFDITASRTFTPAAFNQGDVWVSLRSNRCGSSSTTWSIDHVELRVTFTYNVEAEYVFLVSTPENWWTRIDLADASAGDPSCLAEIYRHGATAWESLGWTLGTVEAPHAAALTSAVSEYVNASDQVRVRYRCEGMTAPQDLAVDLLTLTVTYAPYVETRLEYVYEFTTDKRATLTGLTVADRSRRVTDNVDAQAWNWVASSWSSLYTVGEGGETAHSASPAPAVEFVEAGTGAIRVRYHRVTTSEGVLPEAQVDLLEVTVDYEERSLDVEFTFTATLDATSWTRIWINDSASAPPGASASVYNQATPGWEDLGGAYTSTESGHAYSLAANAPDYADASDRIRIRYAWSALIDPGDLALDLLEVTVTGNTAPTLASFTGTDEMSSRDPSALNDDGVDWTEVAGEVEDVNGEADVVAIEVRLYSSFDGSSTTYSRTVTAGDRAQNLEPGSVDNQVVVWNPGADDDRLSFKFRHVWQTEDHTDPEYYEFTAGALDTWGTVLSFPAQKITRTVEAWAQLVINDGMANRVYDATGTATAGAWGQWTAAAGETLVQSGAGGNEEGRYIKIENIGTGSGLATISWDDVAFVGDSDPSWTIPIDGVLDFHYAIGTTLDPSTVGSWTTAADDADGTIILSIGPGLVAWVWYGVDVPDPAWDQGYSQTFTVVGRRTGAGGQGHPSPRIVAAGRWVSAAAAGPAGGVPPRPPAGSPTGPARRRRRSPPARSPTPPPPGTGRPRPVR